MRAAPFLLLLLLLCNHCARRAIDAAHLKQLFAQPEYLASGDGWAEARRRAALKKYLGENAIPFHETQQPKPGAANDKYRQVTIVIPGSGESATGDSIVTLALVPGPTDSWRETIGLRQRQCDAVLFRAIDQLTALRQQHKRILLTMDQACSVERLTGRLDAAK